MISEKRVYKQLKKVLDPELNINIVDLGLIYEVKTKQDGQVKVLMTLTFPGCPLGSVIREEINLKLSKLPGVKKIDLKLTFKPAWDFSKVSEEAKLQLGVI